jgi:hypothetical protein
MQPASPASLAKRGQVLASSAPQSAVHRPPCAPAKQYGKSGSVHSAGSRPEVALVQGQPKLPSRAHALYSVTGAGWSSRCVASPGTSASTLSASGSVPTQSQVGVPHAWVPIWPFGHVQALVAPRAHEALGGAGLLHPMTRAATPRTRTDENETRAAEADACFFTALRLSNVHARAQAPPPLLCVLRRGRR